MPIHLPLKVGRLPNVLQLEFFRVATRRVRSLQDLRRPSLRQFAELVLRSSQEGQGQHHQTSLSTLLVVRPQIGVAHRRRLRRGFRIRHPPE